MKIITLDVATQTLNSRYLLGNAALNEARQVVGRAPAVCIVDQPVRRHHSPALGRVFAAGGRSGSVLALPGGERVKTLAMLERIYAWLAGQQLARDGYLIGIGGGAVLDVAGLAAATWQRGIAFVSVPTTLLAMVDAAIGGKTAVNTAGLKNPVGSFHPAVRVLAAPALLSSLPRTEWRNGLAELIKTAVIGSRALLLDLLRREDTLRRLVGTGDRRRANPDILRALPWTDWIGRAARIKVRIVNADFQESGPRQALNLGHTLGHVLEAFSLDVPGRRGDTRRGNAVRPLSHGEAVAVGMATVFRVAVARGMCPAGDAARLERLLGACGLPVTAPAPPRKHLERLLAGDKKMQSGQVRWVLPQRLGRVVLDQRVSCDEVLTHL